MNIQTDIEQRPQVDRRSGAGGASPQEPALQGGVSDASQPSIRHNAAWMLAANLVYAACQWGMLSLLAHLADTAVVGKYVLATAIITPVMAFCMLNLRSVQATDARREFSFRVYFALRITATLAALGVITGIGVAAGYGWDVTSVLSAVAIAAALEAVSDVFYGAQQQRERLLRVAQSLMLKSVLGITCFACVLAVTSNLCWAVLSVAATRLAVLLGWDVPQTAKILGQIGAGNSRVECDARSAVTRHQTMPRAVATLAIQALPLGVVMMLIALGASIPRYFVERHLGEQALGIFGAIAYFRMVGIIAMGAVGQSASPQLAVAAAEGRRSEFFQLLGRLAAFATVLAVAGVAVAVVAGRPLLRLTYGPDYAVQHLLLVWLMVAAIASYPASLVGFSLTAARCFYVQIPLYAASVTATFATCAWLIPRYGMSGAAFALLAAGVVQIVGAMMVLAYTVPHQPALSVNLRVEADARS